MKCYHAGIWDRFLAFATDYIIIGSYITFLAVAGFTAGAYMPELSGMLFSAPLRGQAIGFLLITLPVSLYFGLLESSEWRASWGKRKRGLQVIRTNGSKLHRIRAFVRTLLKFIPWELAHTCIWQVNAADQENSPLIRAGFVFVWILVGVYIFSMVSNHRNQTVYDMLTDSLVVIKPQVQTQISEKGK